jgi:hypothetical protein
MQFWKVVIGMSEGDISSDIEHIAKETHQILLIRRIKPYVKGAYMERNG